ncbi:S8 family peptidase [Phytohabitans houttuyneae]|uniref:S8 family peptidase n=1 Tax=Phytohabitans houttuyneae TaxID=1076126 RepID=UPI001FEC71B6|nr:S8 family serine peptidase [Phytohabitans houttuyneae]
MILLLFALIHPTSAAAASTVDPGPLPPGQTYTVTLLSGDVVTVHTRATGCPVVSVRPATPDGVLQRSCGADGHVRVIPGRVASLIGKVLDEDLFDVTTLIMEGYDDARTKELPLIVRPGTPAAASRAPLAAGLRAKRDLPSVAAVAGRQAKDGGAAFVRALPADGAKVWLDRRVRATAILDRNITQVAAPRAWTSGYTGVGAKIAILDTGVDPTHPDLAGRVTEKVDFTVEGGDAIDRHGHGTHVAAVAAGSGAGARGERSGIAPGADLLAGKVLDDQGNGMDSQVIAGMEWAASRADVVNMSLGGWEPSDGTDPMSMAVDTLTRKHGTLFVVAAGNDGYADRLITAPAAAASALTVGAVDARDRLADFSSRGPVINTNAAKPEIVAPGVDIVAARAAGTAMGRVVDERYTAASGTSMAAPHVAGAAALLVQRHPGWDATRLKAALVGAADRLPGADPYEVGAGRLDATAVLDSVVGGQGVVNLGPVTSSTTLTWTNTGDSMVAMPLGVRVVDRHGATFPAATVTPRLLAMRPGATGTATLRVDRSGLAPGFYAATVSGTLVTFQVEPPSHELTLTMTTLPNAPDLSDIAAFGNIVNLDDPAAYAVSFYLSPEGTIRVRVPAGRFSVVGSVWEFAERQRVALTGDPDVTIAADTTVVLDAASARPVSMAVEGVKTEASAVGILYEQRGRRGGSWDDFAYAWGEDARLGSVFAVPMEQPEVGEFHAYTAAGLHASGARLYDLIHAHPSGLTDLSPVMSTASLIRIDQRFHRLDAPDEVTGHKRYGLAPSGLFVLENFTTDVTGNRVDYVSPGYAWIDEAFYAGGVVTQEPARTYAPGSRHQKTWVRQPLRTDFYDAAEPSPSGCVPTPPSRTRGNLHIQLVELTDQHQRFACFDWEAAARRLALYRDGALLGEHQASAGDFAVPAAAGAYRLTYDLDVSGVLPVSTRVNTAWTFRSAAPRGTGSAPLPLLSVDYALPLTFANHPAGGAAEFAVLQAVGVPRQKVTSFRLWTSLDDGVTWRPVSVRSVGSDRYRAVLPAGSAVSGSAVSLKVSVSANGGSAFEQTIIRAYRS